METVVISLLTAMTLGYVAAFAFLPFFLIALFMLKSATRAFVMALVFTSGALAGFALAALAAGLVVGHAVSSDTRLAMTVAFTSAGAAAGGVLAVWALVKARGFPLR